MSGPGYRLGSEEKVTWSFAEVVQNFWAQNSPEETLQTSGWGAFLTLLCTPDQGSSCTENHGMNFPLEGKVFQY